MSDITIPVGTLDLPGYLAVPEGEGPWPAVVVLFEAVGATQDMRDQADRLAREGYLAVLPDLYSGKPWVRCVRKAMQDMMRQRGRAYDAIEATRAWVAGREDCTGKVGVIGFCLGGGFALVAAAKYDFQAAAVNYGIVPRDAAKVLEDACPIVASYGASDRSLKGAARKLELALTEVGVPHDVKEYPDTGHSFVTDSKIPAFAAPLVKITMGIGRGKENAPDAWNRIFAFFGEHLGEKGSTT